MKYPIMYLDSSHRRVMVSRVICFVFFGLEINDPTTHACHKCDNPKCLNPDHLFVGSHQENMEDAKTKGRMRSGTNSPRAVLTSEQLELIFRLDGEKTGTEISRIIGCSTSVVSEVLNKYVYSKETSHLKRKTKFNNKPIEIPVMCVDDGRTFNSHGDAARFYKINRKLIAQASKRMATVYGKRFKRI